jgi:hypothetical protein
VLEVPVLCLKDVPEEEMKAQFKTFVERLGQVTADCYREDLNQMDPKELIKQFFDPACKLFKDIEMIMQAMAVCAVKHSCESVLESFVSRYENHFDARRNTEEESTNEEFEIAVNGPNLANCNAVVTEAMTEYWKSRGGSWHFFRVSVVEKLNQYKGDSEVMHRLFGNKNSLPFMN